MNPGEVNVISKKGGKQLRCIREHNKRSQTCAKNRFPKWRPTESLVERFRFIHSGTHGKEFEGERKHYTQNQMPAACLRNILVHNLPFISQWLSAV